MFDRQKHVDDINNNGFTIIKNGIDIDLINKVIKDFDEWGSITSNNFTKFNFDRVTNFHVNSKNTLDLVTNKYVDEILTFLFKKKQTIYSSLFFREGTSQHYHRDTPHFFTNPIDQYYGVWYSLEDINIKSGPLKYYIGSHKLDNINGYEIFNDIYKDNKDNIDLNSDFRCIIKYNEKIENLCRELNLTAVDEKNYINQINKGDIIIWHPKLLHGGSDIIDKTLTRYSMVTHNIPIDTAVFNAKHFFTKAPTEEYLTNKNIWKYINHNDINIVDHGIGPMVQKGYT
jgi:phytanoyl-CoA hydroxylase